MYMPHILVAVAAICLINPAWRVTAAFVLGASMFNIFIVSEYIVPTATPQDLYFIAGLTDAVTAGLILKFGQGGRFLQAGILSAFIFTNALLLIELKIQPVFVYHHYENMIFAWNLCQLALFWGGLSGAFRKIMGFDGGMVGGDTSGIYRIRHTGGNDIEPIKGQIK